MRGLPTIAGISTPAGISGIAIIRISGQDAIEIVDKIFKSPKNKLLKNLKTHTMCYGYIIEPNTQEVIDETLVSVMRAPNTYTREDIVEINSHGGLFVAKKILEQILKNGAVLAQPGEFTKRAFLSGRIDITQAEAVADIIFAKTEEQLRIANIQLQGNVSKKIKIIKDKLLNLLSELEVVIDYPEEDIQEKQNYEIENLLKEILFDVEKIAATFEEGRLLKQGIATCIVGKPNVGKSTLFNQLVGENRVIVTDIPGTTRDIVEKEIVIQELLLSLKDTAGIRDTKNKIEKIGIDFTKKEIEASDLILFIIDLSTPISKEDIEIFNLIKNKKIILILNKIDLLKKTNRKEVIKKLRINSNISIIETSLIKKNDLDKIKKEILKQFHIGKIQHNDIIITSLRHKMLLDETSINLKNAISALHNNYPKDLISIDIREALNSLSMITGEITTEDILNNIFEKFCVGK